MEYPIVQLHLHLDGAIPNDLFVKYCRKMGFVGEDVSDEQWVQQNTMTESMSLTEGLQKFVLLTAILQERSHLVEVTETLLNNSYDEGSRLVEVRFSPQSHTQAEMDMEEAVKAVLEGREKALKKHPDLVCGILLCMMHHDQNWGRKEDNINTVYLAHKYKDHGVVGIDLAGDEMADDITDYRSEFELARKLGVNYTIHAGESGPASNVQFAIDEGATRVGHGVHSVYDDKVVENLIRAGVTLEVSLTSNIMSDAFDGFESHPLRKLFDRGVKINLNTDDPSLFGIDILHEYEAAKKHYGFSDKELIRMNLDGALASFCEGKEKIVEKLEEALKKYEQ